MSSKYGFDKKDLYQGNYQKDIPYDQGYGYHNNPNIYNPQYTSSPAQPDYQNFSKNALSFAAHYIDPNQLAHQGFDAISKQVDQYKIISNLRQYFDVDLKYICKKFYFLFFPYLQKDWGRVNNDQSLPPRMDHNALDLYIPVMSFLTYVFVCSLSLGYSRM
ncbi:hypothetical protein HZS_5794 [Henneguya salminicola]|nr:hypothetical protein HZS_5794 [Henneguya salminicola]